jgi:preprotein translocase subunit SecA
MSTVGNGLFSRISSVVGGPVRRRLAKYAQVLPQIEKFGEEIFSQSDAELRKRSLALRYRAKSRESLGRLLPEAYALVREAGKRTLNMRHFDVQLLGGTALHYRAIAEMQTGEGKTLTATLPLYLAALSGHGAHLATVNDYLAKRDAEWMRPIYELLGISVGVIQTPMLPAERRKNYACDITYGTSKEFGFDFLRDRLLLRRMTEGQTDLLALMLGQRAQAGGDQPVQRAPQFCLVDEADSVLIDEARTPLIISALPTEEDKAEAELYKWAATVAPRCVEEEHYTFDPKTQKVELTADGRRLVRSAPRTSATEQVGMIALYEAVELAIRAHRAFFLDRHYVIRNGEIVIVDEFTGRLAEGRKWRDGLHQAIEAKEGVKVTLATGHAARITIQDYFLRYPQLAGMTGTAVSSARELFKIYKLRVLPIPTNKPPIRQPLATMILARWKPRNGRSSRKSAKCGRASGRCSLARDRSTNRCGSRSCSTKPASSTRCSPHITWTKKPKSWRAQASAGELPYRQTWLDAARIFVWETGSRSLAGCTWCAPRCTTRRASIGN